MYGSERRSLGRTDERRSSGSSRDAVAAVCSRFMLLTDKKSGEIRSQLGMRKLGKKIHEMKKNWMEHLLRMLTS
jgi:predicted thioredoxin/glutaredoxin